MTIMRMFNTSANNSLLTAKYYQMVSLYGEFLKVGVMPFQRSQLSHIF